MKLANTNWTVDGIYLSHSDALYEGLVSAINTGNVTEGHLRKISGHAYPITINSREKHIQFCPF